MKVELLRPTWLKGELAKTGEVVEASSEDAKTLIQLGKAQVASVCEVKKKTTAKRKKTTTPIKEEISNDS